MMLFQWFKHKSLRRIAAQRLYQAALAQSRHPDFYSALAVADTTDGHFDLLSLHVFLIINRLNELGRDGKALGQALFDAMFRRMDLDLREMGVGDLGVPKHMKRMMKAFNGRAAIYHDLLIKGDVATIEAALTRNIYKADGQVIAGAKILADYTVAAHGQLQSLPLEHFRAENFTFPSSLISPKDDVRRSA